MAEPVKITVTENAPLSVKGPITLVDQDGTSTTSAAASASRSAAAAGRRPSRSATAATCASAFRPPNAPLPQPTPGARREARIVRVEVNLDRCEADGICESLAPEVFELDDDDQLNDDQQPDGSLRAKVGQAVAAAGGKRSGCW